MAQITQEQKAAFRWLLPNMYKIDAMQSSIEYCKAYGVSIDWHEFSNYLDELYRLGILIHSGSSRDGMSQYRLFEKAHDTADCVYHVMKEIN